MNNQKDLPYRSKFIMNAAKDAPYCMDCGKPNDGTIVGCHYTGPRQHSFGKATGKKGTDSAVAYLCSHCHKDYDDYKDKNDVDRSERFLFAVVKSHDWMFKYFAKDAFGRWVESFDE